MGRSTAAASTIARVTIVALVFAFGGSHVVQAKSPSAERGSGGPTLVNGSPMVAFAPTTTYSTCFTPGQDCEGVIVSQIDRANSSILMQAYAFTSAPIARALIRAKQRGVDVRAVVDKSLRTEKYSGVKAMLNAGIPVAVDDQPAIAHSKVLIFDQQVVLTGSFNFTRAAQQKNVENLIVIAGDLRLVQAYTVNWTARWNVSAPY